MVKCENYRIKSLWDNKTDRTHWSYDKSKAFTVNLLGGRDGYFVCALPYQMAIKEGLKKRSEIEDEMSE